MISNFSSARSRLEEAYEHLQGDDRTSRDLRKALDLLIDTLIAAEFTRKSATVLTHPRFKRRPRCYVTE